MGFGDLRGVAEPGSRPAGDHSEDRARAHRDLRTPPVRATGDLTWEQAAASVEHAKRTFRALAEDYGKQTALNWFNGQVYAWSKAFTK
jgi:hypothetical protein